MEYIVHKRFCGKAICGNVDLPVMTVCDSTAGFIHSGEQVYCFEKSENAHQHFARNDDGKGLERGNLVQRITAKLQSGKQELWDRIWDDELCQQFKRIEFKDYWLWNHNFYNAEISELRHIAALIDA